MGKTLYDGLTIFVEVSFASGSGFGVWDSGGSRPEDSRWDSATWGPDVTWTDITEYVMDTPAMSFGGGFGRHVQSWEAGRAQFTLKNTDGRFSPTNLSGPYVAGGVSEIRPWRPARIYATYNSVTYPLWRGYILSWREDWTVDDAGQGVATVTASCVDELASLARYDGFEGSSVGGGELFGARVHRVLNNAGHIGTRNVDVGETTMQGTTLAQNTVTELKLTADSEGGTLWVDGEGTIVAEGQLSLLTKTRSTVVQATFGEGASELPYSDIELAYDGDQIANVVAFARVGGTQQTASDLTSRALYGDKRYARNDLICQTDAQASTLAELHLHRNKDPELRVEQIEVRPRKNPATLFPEVLGRRPLDLIRVKRTPPGGDAISRDVFVSGIFHRVSAGNWVTTYRLASATAYQGRGVWDTATWNGATWAAA